MMPARRGGGPSRVTLRAAVRTDSDAILQVSNDPDVRANSFQSDAITAEEHTLWFDGHLRDPQRPLYVLDVDGEVAGQVRFEPHGTQMRLSYSIAREFRGRGLARLLVADGCIAMRDELGPLDIIATTKPDNLRSQRVLETVGFRRLDPSPARVDFMLEGGAPIVTAPSEETKR